MKQRIKRGVRKAFSRAGYDIYRRSPANLPAPISGLSLTEYRVETERIPGMTDLPIGELLYALCSTQVEQGDVLEIGSWQGRSTAYLARACKDSGNGHVIAIDPFTGNPGKEQFYRVERDDLSDLPSNFERNVAALGLSEWVELFPVRSEVARSSLSSRRFRFMYIDGDHSAKGAQFDVEAFTSLALPGAFVVFDDFNTHFPGVVSAATRWVAEAQPSIVFSVGSGTLVCKTSSEGPLLDRA